MEKLFINIFQMSIYASYLILAVLLVRFLLRKAPKSMRSFLWLLVGIRLLVPFSVESVFSLIPNTQIADAVIDTTVQPEPDTLSNIPATKPSVSQSVTNTILPANGKHTDKAQTAVQFLSLIHIFPRRLTWRSQTRSSSVNPLTTRLSCSTWKSLSTRRHTSISRCRSSTTATGRNAP